MHPDMEVFKVLEGFFCILGSFYSFDNLHKWHKNMNYLCLLPSNVLA